MERNGCYSEPYIAYKKCTDLFILKNIKPILTGLEGNTGKYWPEVEVLSEIARVIARTYQLVYGLLPA